MAVSQLIRDRRMHGYLAYLGGRLVGWCNAASRAQMTTLQDGGEVQADRIGSIVCFVIAKPYRGQGIAPSARRSLCRFPAAGFEIAEAYPRQEAQNEAANYHGPLATYLAAGFETVREADGIVTVRTALR